MKTKINIIIKGHLMIMIFSFFILSSHVFAKNVTWTGAVSSSWSNIANWSSWDQTGMPSASDDVFIGCSPNQPLIDTDIIISSLTIDGKGKTAILKLDGVHHLTVTGDILVANRKTDKIISAASTIEISNGGSLLGDGEMDLSSNGILYITGDLHISDMIAGKTTGSKVIFNGKSQIIDNGREYHFNDLDIRQGYTSLLHTNLRIDGNLLGGGTLSGENNKIQLAGDMMLVSYKPGTSTFELASAELGSASVQQLNANTFYILENFNQKTVLTGRIIIIHQVDFEKGNICLGNHNIYLSAMVNITRGADLQLSHLHSGSKGYFIANGTGSVKPANHFLFSKKVSPELSRNMASEFGFVDNK